MSWTGNTSHDWREETGSAARRLAGLVRHMAVKVTAGSFWQVVGHLLFDGVKKETLGAGVFSGGGFYWRPKAGSNAEAIVVFPGGSDNPMIVALRDEDLRRKMANLDQDEAAMVNTQAGVFITSDGFVEVRQDGGAGVGLALASELNNLREEYEKLLNFVNVQFFGVGHVHAVSGAATTSTTPIPPLAPASAPAAYPGTQVLLGE